jgi:hypothetical protein
MNRRKRNAWAGWLVGFFCLAAAAQEDTAPPVSMSWSGYMQTDDRLDLNDAREFTWQEYRFDLRSDLKVQRKARFFSEVWVRDIGFPQLNYYSELQKSSSVLPMDLSLRKAYVEIYDAAIPSLDLSIGRQRFVWGTADKINPTDNLNPDDLEDIWDMGRHIGSDGIQAKYYLGKVTLSAVFIPFFRPAVLPAGAAAAAIKPKLPDMPGMSIHSVIDTLIFPALKPAESSSGAIKTAIHFTGFDASISYTYCRDDIPVLTGLALVPQAQSRSQADIDLRDGTVEIKEARSTYLFPRLHIAGVDLAGMIGRLGFWGEAAMYLPEKRIDMKTSFQGNDTVTQVFQSMHGISSSLYSQQASISGDPYIKFAAGIDCTLPWNMYFNVQYVHGFVHERGDSLEDYMFFNADWNFFNNKLKISPFGVILEIKNYGDFANSYAVVDQPQIAWLPVENAEIAVGVRLIDASSGTYFGNFKNNEAFLRIKYGF